MRRLTSVSLGLLVLALVFLQGCSSQVAEGTVVTVFYSSETRGRFEGCGCKHNGGGITKRSGKLKAARAEDSDIVYCDAGNFLSGTSEADNSGGQLSVDAYNLLQVKAVNVSERELALGMDKFREARSAARFDFVSANVRAEGSLVTDSYVVKFTKGARIAYVGLCGSREVMRIDSAKLPADVTIDDPLTTARRVLPEVKAKADLILVLSSCGDATDSLIAQEFPFVHAVIGSRSFRSNEDSPWIIENTRVVRAQRDGRSLGRLDFLFGKNARVEKVQSSRIDLETSDPGDEEMLTLIRAAIPNFVDNPQDGVRIKQ
ncbi:bifunctional metallophosphatase/5'-nucleotidase [bacterium]|nr:bifunctional metallophosphatase/5'-nucleotidase [bacterium]